MAGLSYGLQVSCCSSERPRLFDQSKASIPSSISLKPLLKDFLANPIFGNVSQRIKEASISLVDAFVDQTFEFTDQPLIPSQSNFAPVEEIGEAIDVTAFVDGLIPDTFPEGVYIRNGPNPLFGGTKSTRSIFGQSSHTWIEGDGMLHALYFSKKDKNGQWNISYRNKQVETNTLEVERRRNKPSFLPAIEGDSAAVLAAYFLNMIRFGCGNKDLSNTSVFEHSGKFFSAAENHLPQEIDIFTLKTKRYWDVNGAWTRPFTSHPKKDPVTGELVIMGVSPLKPYFEVGIVSADGKKLIHRADLNLDRCSLCHEMGITTRYNVILDFPVTIDLNRLMSGGPLIKYDKEGYARIGIMPRYGDKHSVKWFRVKTGCIFHILNCYEQNDEVVILACRSDCSIIPGPDFGLNKFEWFSERFEHILDEKSQEEKESFLARIYEWRLNTNTGEVSEANLTSNKCSMDFPMINEKYCGSINSFGYTQVLDPRASSLSGTAKYGALAKIYFKERKLQESGDGGLVKVEYHKFPANTFCTGAAFVAKPGGVSEDDGWIITYVHDEDGNTSQAYIVDAKRFMDEPVAKIVLPRRVPYGFHGTFVRAAI